jgi:hypothetical protein
MRSNEVKEKEREREGEVCVSSLPVLTTKKNGFEFKHGTFKCCEIYSESGFGQIDFNRIG